MTQIGLAAELDDPAFLAIHPSQRYLYALCESSAEEGSVVAFKIDPPTGRLERAQSCFIWRLVSRPPERRRQRQDAGAGQLRIRQYGSFSSA